MGDWIGIILGLSFCLSFGYWTTNFAEVQRAMAAKDGRSARLTPIIGAYPKTFVPLITVLPGMAALVLLPGIGTGGEQPGVQPGHPRPDGRSTCRRVCWASR